MEKYLILRYNTVIVCISVVNLYNYVVVGISNFNSIRMAATKGFLPLFIRIHSLPFRSQRRASHVLFNANGGKYDNTLRCMASNRFKRNHFLRTNSYGCDGAKFLSTIDKLRDSVASAVGGSPASDEKKEEKQKKWWNTSKEFKIFTSVLLGLFSWTMTSYYDRQRAIKDVRLEHVTRQIRDLYGPLYGNRLVQEKTYRAVMGEHGGLRRYLKQAEETKDADMIRRWRSFVWNVLYPLDKQAETLICRNAHLITHSQFPEAFDHFLNHLARLQFVMEHWKSEDGKLEAVEEFTPDDFLEKNNASGDRGIKEMLRHVEETYKELREIQKKLKVEVEIEDNGEHAVTVVLAKLTKVR